MFFPFFFSLSISLFLYVTPSVEDTDSQNVQTYVKNKLINYIFSIFNSYVITGSTAKWLMFSPNRNYRRYLDILQALPSLLQSKKALTRVRRYLRLANISPLSQLLGPDLQGYGGNNGLGHLDIGEGYC